MANGKWQIAILTLRSCRRRTPRWCTCFETLRRELGSSGSRFVGRVTGDGTWRLNWKAAGEVLRMASQKGQRLLMLGTAFSFVHLLDHLAEQELWFELPPGSCALETGGYKAVRIACRKRRCTRSSPSGSASGGADCLRIRHERA